MIVRRKSDPYSKFLATRPGLRSFADQVLENIAKYSDLSTLSDFAEAASGCVNTVPASAQAQAVWNRLVPQRAVNRADVLRLALAGRAAEVALGQTPRHHQIVAALLLSQGTVVQMPNGSGKTLAAALAAALHGLAGRHVHIATANDYLAERDTRWMGRLYRLLGLSAGVVFDKAQSIHFEYGVLDADGVTLRGYPVAGSVLPEEPHAIESPHSPSGGCSANCSSGTTPNTRPTLRDNLTEEYLPHETTETYRADRSLTLGDACNSEVLYSCITSLGFLYLSDNRAHNPSYQVLTRRDVLIVDECDVVMIDDLSTPLVLSKRSERHGKTLEDFQNVFNLAKKLVLGVDFFVSGKTASLTLAGADHASANVGHDLFTPEAAGAACDLVHALEALYAYHKDLDYVVKDGQIVPIDTDTERLVPGRRYHGGQHQMLEVKEGLSPSPEDTLDPVNKITIKHFVKTYSLVSGMSGTMGSPEEYRLFYELESVNLQPYSQTRVDHPDHVVLDQVNAVRHAAREAVDVAARGRPVLLKAPSLRIIEELAHIMDEANVLYQRLDATTVRNLGEEADHIAQAGDPGKITICSKVAARGTDIVLAPRAREAGGLFVIGIGRGKYRRYDDQLRGRAGRHGEPGDSLFVMSMEDELLKMTGADRVMGLLGTWSQDMNDDPLDSPMVARSIERIQRQFLRGARTRRVIEVDLDDILARHRTIYFDIRQEILTKPHLREELNTVIDNWVHVKQETILRSCESSLDLVHNGNAALAGLQEILAPIEIDQIMETRSRPRRAAMLRQAIQRRAESLYESRSEVLVTDVVRRVLLHSIDTQWESYLAFEENLREEIKLATPEKMFAPKYSSGMEERFDTFFYEAGERVLKSLFELGRTSHLFVGWPAGGGPYDA